MTGKNNPRRLRWFLGPALSLGVFVAIDQGPVRIAVAKEIAKGRTLPPFCLELTDDQKVWLDSIAGDKDQRTNTIFRFDPELGWDNEPWGKDHYGLSSTNSMGFRGSREYAVPKPTGVLRIVCVGDSYTWGADVNDEAPYPAALERLGEGLEAPNLGVSAYGSGQALLRFRRDGIALEPDVAVLGLMVENIGRNVNRYRPLWATYSTVTCVKPRFMLEGDQLVVLPIPFQTKEELIAAVRDGSVLEKAREGEYWRTLPQLHFLARSPSARFLGGVLARRQRKEATLWTDSAGEPYRVTRAIIESFQREALAAGAERALVVLLPHREALHLVAGGQTGYWVGMLRELEEQGFEVLDVTHALIEEHRRMTADGEPSPMYSRRNHLLPHYNEVVARAILEKLALL